MAEVEAWGTSVPVTRQNVAASANGGTATASETNSAPYAPSGAINGDRKFYANNAWANSTPTFPQWLQVDFNGSKDIDEIDVFSVQDNAGSPSEPTLAMTFSAYGLTAFQVQYWNGSAWTTVPGGSVTGNNHVWKQITFSAITTTKIRVWITASSDNYSRMTELEAWGVPTGSSSTSSVQWLISDHLGTPRMVLDQSGALNKMTRHDYLPFGEELFAPTSGRSAAQGYASGDRVRQQFTQKERDVETQLDYFVNRYYSEMQGRFTSADPENAGGYAGNPQTWNAYSYGLNIPTLYTDPDGLKVRICGTDGQCTDDKTDLSDDQFKQWFRQNGEIRVKNGNIYKNGELIGTYERLSCDECLYDIHDLGRRVVASDPGRRAAVVWGSSVVAGLSIPSAGVGYVFIGVFTVLVPPPEDKGGDTALSIKSDRQAAVREAWRQEAERARSGQSTKTPFTADELRELRETGKVSGYEGHHVESVSANPATAANPDNIKFVKGRAAHLEEHGGNWRNRTPLKPE